MAWPHKVAYFEGHWATFEYNAEEQKARMRVHLSAMASTQLCPGFLLQVFAVLHFSVAFSNADVRQALVECFHEGVIGCLQSPDGIWRDDPLQSSAFFQRLAAFGLLSFGTLVWRFLKIAAQKAFQQGFLKLFDGHGHCLEPSLTLEAAGIDGWAPVSAIVQLPQLVSTCGAFALWCHSGVITWGHEGKGGDSNDVQDQLKDVKKVVAAYSCLINDLSFAALTNNGQVVHWGGQYEKLYPNVASDLDVVDLSATSCALALILSDGTVMTWGDPEGGGDSSAVNADLIKVHSVVGTVEAFAASFAAILETGGVVAWGVEFLGGDVRVPYAETVHKLQNVKDIRAAAWAFAALLGNGTVVAWGNPGMGGDYLEVQDQLTDVCSVHATSTAFAALKTDGSVVTWGHGVHGGDSSSVQGQLIKVVDISSTDRAFAAILSDGSVVTWGDSDYGADSRQVQHQLRNVKQLQGTDRAFCAILGDGSVVTWGIAMFGGDCSSVQEQLKRL
eukprot:symbB.v1.2.015519.t1/scaffold1152.1/size135547/9